MADSAIVPAKEAVMRILEGARSLENITITDDKEPETKNEYIWFHSIKADREWKLLGGNPAPQEETLIIRLRCTAIKGVKETTPSFERAMEIYEAMEKVLRENITLEDTVLYHNISEVEGGPVTYDKARGHVMLVTIKAKARI